MDLLWAHKNLDRSGRLIGDAVLVAAWTMRHARATAGPAIVVRAVDHNPAAAALRSLLLAQDSIQDIDPGSCLAFTLSAVVVSESVSRMLPERRFNGKLGQNQEKEKDEEVDRLRLLVDFSVYRAQSSGFIRGLANDLDLKENTRLHDIYPGSNRGSDPSSFALICEKSLRVNGYARVVIRLARNPTYLERYERSVKVAIEGLLMLSERLQDRLGRPMFAIIPHSEASISGNDLPRVNRSIILNLVPCSEPTNPSMNRNLLLHEPHSALIKWHGRQKAELDRQLDSSLAIQMKTGFLAPIEKRNEASLKMKAAEEDLESFSEPQSGSAAPSQDVQVSEDTAKEMDRATSSTLRRYIIAAENCQVKPAASAIARELIDNGQCLILAEAGMDISSALKVISEARKRIRQSTQGGLASELLFKVRCYPDLEDSVFFESFPALFALAFHLVRVPQEAVSNHLATIATQPTSPADKQSDESDEAFADSSYVDISASNYLRVNSVNEEEEEEEEESMDSFPQLYEDEGESADGLGGSRASSLSAADGDRPLHLQQRLAQRALVELATHSFVHLAAASSSARIAAVRTAAIITDALCCGSPPHDGKSSQLQSQLEEGDLNLTRILAALRGLEALVLMRDINRMMPDGFRVPVTTFTLMIGAGLDPGLAREQSRRLKGEVMGVKDEEWGAAPIDEARGDEDQIDLCLIDSRSLF